MVNEASIKQFGDNLRGEIVLPNDNSYNDARKVYNGMIDKKPAIIAKCVDVTDVMAADVNGVMLIMLVMLSDLGSRRGLFQLRALEDLLLAAVLAT